DVVLSKRENILVAPLVELDNAETKRSALNRENPRYVPLPLDGKGRFVDLNQITAYAKEDIAGAVAAPGIEAKDDAAVRAFGLAVGRWFGRFAFPDEVQPWLAPIQKQIRDKYESPKSALGQVLHRVAEIRVEADSWADAPRTLTVHVIVVAGWMPVVIDLDAGSTVEPSTSRQARPLAEVATDLLLSKDDNRTVVLWDEFAWSLAALCTPKGRQADDQTVKGAVATVEAMLWTDEDFPLVRYRKSEQLDVDFLSDPTPL
ncbi:MAG TPA: hypothetical protein VJR25_00625, partial [Microbacterium sp.]|uniref:hypothetical protein n=1 Tax=Microbacterium sp. TaxID=51671 RepID=UPI002B49349A